MNRRKLIQVVTTSFLIISSAPLLAARSPAAIPAAPSALAATAASSSRINLAWIDNSSNETGFRIERSTDGTTFTLLAKVKANSSSYSNTGLIASTKYYYRVRAYNSAGDSTFSNTASATTPTPTPTPTPTGIAARYPGDKGIEYDAEVIFADDFESYTSASQLTARWDSANDQTNLRIATEAGNFYAGTKAVEMQLPIGTAEVSNVLNKTLSPEQEIVFLRCYTKFDPGYEVIGSNHNGLRLSAHYPGAGIKAPADGTGFFLFLLQNNIQGSGRLGESVPGYSHIYAYWPRQRDNYGDHWYPDGFVLPYDSALGADAKVIGNRGDWQAFPSSYPNFQPMANWLPERDRWYCYELMVRANTPGNTDGEVKYWIDGNLVGDFPNLNMRSISTLKMDKAHIKLHAKHSERVNKKWYDNVVIATKYIGPIAPLP